MVDLTCTREQASNAVVRLLKTLENRYEMDLPWLHTCKYVLGLNML